jgi:hypothetical protein
MRHRLFVPIAVAAAVAAVTTVVTTGAFARSGGAAPRAPRAAATTCPPFSFVNNTNLAVDASFEIIGPNGSPTTWHFGDPTPIPSAAESWFMHTSNQGATVTSELVPTKVPGPGGTAMLHFIAGGNEGGIYQELASPPALLMFSAWVYVVRGHVALQAQAGNTGPAAWSTKHNQWEQLRVCTDGTVPTGYFVIENENVSGGDFYVDRVEVRETP